MASQAQIRWHEQSDRRRNHLYDRLREVSTYDDVVRLANETPGPIQPGRSYYSNLAFFLGNAFCPPEGATVAELQLYMGVIERIDVNGDLNEGAKETVVKALQDAIKQRDF